MPGKKPPKTTHRFSQRALFFNIIQGLAHFHQDKFIRSVLIYLRHVPIEYCAIFFDQNFYISDDFTAMSLQFLLLDRCHFILSSMFRRCDGLF